MLREYSPPTMCHMSCVTCLCHRSPTPSSFLLLLPFSCFNFFLFSFLYAFLAFRLPVFLTVCHLVFLSFFPSFLLSSLPFLLFSYLPVLMPTCLIMHPAWPKAGHRRRRWTGEARQGAHIFLLVTTGYYKGLLFVLQIWLLQMFTLTGYKCLLEYDLHI